MQFINLKTLILPHSFIKQNFNFKKKYRFIYGEMIKINFFVESGVLKFK